jgi:hypothetical protein
MALDEVTTVDQQQKLMFLAAKMADDFPELQIVVTGRDYVSGPAFRWLPRVNLAKLTDDQVSELIENWIGDDRDVLGDFQAQLSKVGTLRPLMRIPLLGTLIIAVYKRMRSLPENKVKLYEIFMELMCGGWDLAKNVRRESKFGPNVKLSVLTRLAGVLQRSEKREAVEADLKTAVTNTVFALAEKWRSLLDELLEDGLLVRTTYGVAFSHLSFQEFLAAKDLADPAGGRKDEVLKTFLNGDDRWREVLSFYVAMSNKPDEMAVWIKGVSGNETYTRADFLLKRIAESSPGWIHSKEVLTGSSANKDI